MAAIPDFGEAEMLQRYWSALKTFLHIIFGDFNYRPPAWGVRASNAFARSRFGLWCKSRCQWIKANPRLSARYGGIAFVVAAALGYGAYRGYLWYESRPKPDYAKVKIRGPYSYDLENKRSQPVTIEFSQSVAPLESLDKSPEENISLSPKILGKWRWVNDHEIEFAPASTDDPKSHWTAGEKYSVSLKKKLVAKHILLEKYDYDFQAKEMKAKLNFYQKYGAEEYYVIDPDRRTVIGYIRRKKKLVEIPDNVLQTYCSPRLGIRFHHSGEVLTILGPTGERFLSFLELGKLAEAEKKRADSQKRRADSQQRRADTQKRRADHAEVRAEAAEAKLAVLEAKAHEIAARRAKLAEKLRELGIDPDDY